MIRLDGDTPSRDKGRDTQNKNRKKGDEVLKEDESENKGRITAELISGADGEENFAKLQQEKTIIQNSV